MELPYPALFYALLVAVAFLYASVGHGGASGYLAAMSLYAFAPKSMSVSALILNIFVSGAAFLCYWKAGHFQWRWLWPFLILSLPMAYIGAMFRVSPQTYSLFLAATLLVAALRLNVNMEPEISTEPSPVRRSTLRFALAVGGGGLIGAVSGIVGIGGGIFLSCLLLLTGWCTTKQSCALAAPFILVNSVAGLIPRLASGIVWSSVGPQIALTLAGGFLGARLGANRLNVVTLRRILGAVLLIACIKLILTSFNPA